MFTRSAQLWFIMLVIPCMLSCSNNWLNEKPDEFLTVPGTVADYQALLDNVTLLNNAQPGLGEVASGDFHISYDSWQSLFSRQERSAYIWESTDRFYGGEQNTDWAASYKQILTHNIVLEGLQKLKARHAADPEWRNVFGSALFFRSFSLYNLSQLFCKGYTDETADREPGLPLRLSADVDAHIGRSTLRQTYHQITGDLKQAIPYLGTSPKVKTRPSKQAAYALLARVYLSLEDYDRAAVYADSALQIQHGLLNYAALKAGSYPLPRFNEEVIFHASTTYGAFNASRLLVDPDLFAQYEEADLRRTLFFVSARNGFTFRGSYSGDKNLFCGLATDEMYLIRSECYARAGRYKDAIADLSLLLKSRWRGAHREIRVDDAVLPLILKERRKELVFRCLRWSDLRRLNRDERFATTLVRTMNNTTYRLLPNDKRYVFPIDEEEIRLSGIAQNDR
ncbi:RagB/SusD family nutrient uptake outer membrane protein [Pedobacter faecalis]|uniref:RagB/SusD family nutrient uptake outer membrane protein n=1 Tax=Pedobacter faecalis TaxID=3041495 RepID=UPI00254D8955|nr:RagB/SusD family nutrient uptake outer membrane protein [Pedobacter sp. ELA7]